MTTICTVCIVLLAALLTQAVPSPAQPSSVPSCAYTCPTTDVAGNMIASSSNGIGYIECVYNDAEGSDGAGTCQYNIAGSEYIGVVTADNDGGLCEKYAAWTCTSKRRDVLPRSPSLPVLAARAPRPDMMKVMAQLRKRKLLSESPRMLVHPI
ncbi:hypothetical protein CVT25_009593 [Psilocybe cyanescens]|uniref:Uncharacterized protein n=1 Tax=Psilocybe cyanescens TaxID=93625 RepID=A0A409XDJ5_PSICY|nr:hypothetical protein CVT25_009593 [Psilocybe cyanescens]